MQTIYLDISNKGVIPTVYAKRGDVGRKFEVVLTDSGLPYSPAGGSAFSVWYSGASGEGNYTDIGDKSAFSVNGNKVTVEMIAQMLSNDGDGVLSLVLNDPNGNQISTWNIPYVCESVPGANSEEAKSYYTAFSKAVEGLPYPDASLSVPGKAADAAAVGTALAGKASAGSVWTATDPNNDGNIVLSYGGVVEGGGSGGGSGGTPNAVQYVPQMLTNEQKSQARNNIGAMAADAPVVKSVNGNTPDANGNVTVEAGGAGAVELDTTLTQSGKAADAKAVGDALKNVGGVSTTEKTILLSLFKNVEYTADMSATIAQLETLWSGTVIALGPVKPVVVVTWLTGTAAGIPVEYANNVDAVDGAVVFINGSSETFYKKESDNTNNYDILLGKYVKNPDGNIYYINPDSTYAHTTNPSGVVKESISYQKAQLVSVI